jgi:ATP-dependent DNA helicase RecG
MIQPRSVGDYVSMWANTSPDGGLIVIGVSKDKTFEGCLSLGINRLNELEKAAEIYCPDATYYTKRIDIARDKDGLRDFVLVYHILYHQRKVVRTADGKVYIRRGDSKMELRTPEEIRQLQADKGEVSFETESCGLTYPGDFHIGLVADFAGEVRAKKSWNATHSNEEILELMHLGVCQQGAFTPNIGCALLFAKDPRVVAPGCRIRFLRFEGVQEHMGNKWNAVKDEFIDGTIPIQIQQAGLVTASQLRAFSRLGTGGKFFTSPEYPEFAWYEAVVNACVHRSYGNGMRNTPIFIKMFDDRLEVESPGAFPPCVTPKNIYDTHAPRNPYLMDAMYYLDYVKCAHEGTRRMRDEMLEMELPTPEFKQEEVGHTSVRGTLRNSIKQRKMWIDSDAADVIGAKIAESLSENEKRCINFCAEYGKISVSDAQRLTGQTWPAASKMLGQLAARMILLHIHRPDLDRDPQAHFVLNTFKQP